MKILNKLFSNSDMNNDVTHSFNQWMKALLLPLILCSSLASAKDTAIDKIIAIVDDDVVLASELQERIGQIELKIERSGQQGPPPEKLRQDIFDQLILENIQKQLADRAGVRISDEELTNAIQRIAQQNNLTIEKFTQVLADEGQSYSVFRAQMRKDMILQRIQRGHVNQRIQIAEQEVKNFLESEEGKALTAPQYRMIHTLVPVSSQGGDKLKAKAYADKLYQRIENGEDYNQVVKSNSDFSLTANDLGWRTAKNLPGIVSNLIGTLKSGETAAPFKSDSGYHLVKLVDTRGEGEIIPQTKARHILLKASAIRDETATEAELNSLRQQIVDGAEFAALAREHSEDIGTAAEGGDLGWANPGQLVGAFQDAMDNTEIDGISPVFKSQYGWHILQVQERREKDVIDAMRNKMARNYIHQRKYDDELQAWLQKIRDEAYVDIK